MSVVTVTVLRYKPRARFGAFANMGRVLMQPIRAEGLRFSKLMGSGIDFGLIPDLSTYVHLGVWDDMASADAFIDTEAYQQLANGTEHVQKLFLSPLKAHGLWDGQNPFPVTSEQLSVTNSTKQQPQNRPDDRTQLITDNCSLVAVLTRATIRPRALPDFWRHVPQARQRLRDHADDLLFGIGVGEVPLMQQCTVSVWRDAAAVDQYAYKQSGHREVVRLTRQRQWYSEELFARFAVLRWDR
ncbi:MAG: DUF3291 domain-containing protein [Spirosoma sp.]|nr:DUF3291 domain-containing protein [Spirosoma sp.]